MIGIDTNILVRWLIGASPLIGDSPEQLTALERFRDMSDETVFINHIVLAETIWVLRRKAKLNRAETIPLLRQLLDSSALEFQARDVVDAALSDLIRLSGDFSDHLIGAINRQNNCRTTLTFDKAASKSPNFSELKR